MNKEYFRAFPKYEDVFYDDIENHKKYFLPICSINLKCIDPNRNEWFHFLSVKEICGCECVGEETTEFHTEYTKEDMFGFDIIDGKYKFDTNWDYFCLNQKNKFTLELSIVLNFKKEIKKNENTEELNIFLNNLECKNELKNELKQIFSIKKENENSIIYRRKLHKLHKKYSNSYHESFEETYKENEKYFNVYKEFYKKHNKIFQQYISKEKDFCIEVLEEIHKQETLSENKYPEFYGFLDDIKHLSKNSKKLMKEYGININEMNSFNQSNLIEVPRNNEEIFEYIGSLTGFNFQKNGADNLILFQNSELKKAVICLEYT